MAVRKVHICMDVSKCIHYSKEVWIHKSIGAVRVNQLVNRYNAIADKGYVPEKKHR